MSNFFSPKLTIVTVVYNDKEGLERTIRSVVSQSYENIEYIIIDGGSTDGSVEIIKNYQEHIAYWVSEPDSGIYNAMNKGIESATGDYINFLNAGDELYGSDALEKIASCIEGGSKERVYYGKALTIDGDKSWIYPKSSDEEFIKRWESSSMPNHQAMFFPKRFYTEVKYDESYMISADINYKIDAYKMVGYTFCDDIIIKFYLGGISNQDCNFRLILARIRESIKRANRYKQYIDIIKAPTKLLIKYILCNLKTG